MRLWIGSITVGVVGALKGGQRKHTSIVTDAQEERGVTRHATRRSSGVQSRVDSRMEFDWEQQAHRGV